MIGGFIVIPKHYLFIPCHKAASETLLLSDIIPHLHERTKLGITYYRIQHIPVELEAPSAETEPPFYWRVLHARNVNITLENIE